MIRIIRCVIRVFFFHPTYWPTLPLAQSGGGAGQLLRVPAGGGAAADPSGERQAAPRLRAQWRRAQWRHAVRGGGDAHAAAQRGVPRHRELLLHCALSPPLDPLWTP
eukprot:8973328-Pyramimonas_sp.AAC.1